VDQPRQTFRIEVKPDSNTKTHRHRRK